MTTVAHYVERWLDLSAGFVAGHVARSRHRAVVISRDGWLNLDAFPHRPRHSLHLLRNAAPERFKPAVLHAQLRLLLAAHRADVVHVHFGYAAADVPPVLAGRPFVLSLHGHDVTGLLRADPHRYDRVVGDVSAVVVPSRFLAEAAVAAGFPESVIRVIPSGVDTAFFRPSPLPSGPPIVGFAGRLVEKKGIDVLLAAWPQVVATVPDAQLRILGDGPLADAIPTDDPRIERVLPDASRRGEQVRDLLQSAHVVVTPSRTAADGDGESLLLVNLETAATGRPVVSTRHGGIAEYVDDGRTGLLVNEGDSDAVAAAITRLLTEPSLAAALAAAGPAQAARWEAAACSARVDALYDELLAAK
ncbi:MAG TPA: glycosyltransferase [Mycobacteriales bacterium]|nr:glycosyltransferase [Mycobacteriales bacterium]